MRSGVAIATIAAMAVLGAEVHALDVSGDLSLQTRWYPQSPAFPDQRSSAGGLVIEPTFYREITEKSNFTFTPLYRYDSADSQRTHADLREAFLLMYGDWGENAWELRLGLDRVFWGVAEVHNLVDIVNQLDLVEHPRNRPKLGQPMAHLSIIGDWGIAESLLLPYHRKRTFPGRFGRHRAGRPIDGNALYESDTEERHVDVAFRYSNAVGLLDFGLSAFTGTSREPSFLVSPRSWSLPESDIPLIPYYEQIHQFGVDAQLTTEPWLYKLEAIHRQGASNLLGQEENYNAFILGLERTLSTLFGSRTDLTFLAEWLYDGRGRRATSVWDNDLYIAGFFTFNDIHGSELAVGILGDLQYDSRSLNLELKRRLSDVWSWQLEALALLDTDSRDLAYDGRRDSYLGLELTYSF